MLADAFRLPVDAIDRYLLHWGYQIDNEDDGYTHVLQGKAYPDDEARYGDCFQVFDFLRKLGGCEPLDGATLKLP